MARKKKVSLDSSTDVEPIFLPDLSEGIPKEEWKISVESPPSKQDAISYAVSGARLMVEKAFECQDFNAMYRGLDLFYKFMKLDDRVDRDESDSVITIEL